MYSFQTYSKTPLMLSMLGGIVGDAAVQRAMSEYTKAWSFKHPSPWDYIFFMNNALKQDLNWFWYYWLWTTESVDGSIASVTTAGDRTTVTVRQDGQMPSPVVLKVQFAADGPAIKPMANAKMVDDNHGDRHVAGGRVVQRQPDVPGGARLRRARRRNDHARSRLPLPRSRSGRQRVAAQIGRADSPAMAAGTCRADADRRVPDGLPSRSRTGLHV